MVKKKTNSKKKSSASAKKVELAQASTAQASTAQASTAQASTAQANTAQANTVVGALRQVVAVSYALLGQTHLCHWNVRGTSFFSLHNAFEEQYTELFTAIDEIAERIRALGALAPGGLGNLAVMAGMKELNEDASSREMVEHLAAANEALVANLVKARDLAGDSGDDQTEDLMIGRIQVHEKTIWMLRSFLES